MNCRLEFYNPKWEIKVREFKLDETQKKFVALPDSVLDTSLEDQKRHPVIILLNQEPVGFFVLHESEEIQSLTNSSNVILLRAFSIDRKYQGKGFSKLALHILPEFVQTYFPHINEIVLAVHEENEVAKRLYEKSGFKFNNITKIGKKTELKGFYT